ncbi:MAG: desulfoferrodoxin [Methanoregulaceae archaeon]
MAILFEIYKCQSCGHVIKIVHAGIGNLVCCGKPMVRMEEKTADVGSEKHVPVIEKTANGILVKVGSVPHPMLPEHHIEWIEVRFGDNMYVKGLKAGEKPEAEFCVPTTDVKAREYCNVHGLWTNKA